MGKDHIPAVPDHFFTFGIPHGELHVPQGESLKLLGLDPLFMGNDRDFGRVQLGDCVAGGLCPRVTVTGGPGMGHGFAAGGDNDAGGSVNMPGLQTNACRSSILIEHLRNRAIRFDLHAEPLYLLNESAHDAGGLVGYRKHPPVVLFLQGNAEPFKKVHNIPVVKMLERAVQEAAVAWDMSDQVIGFFGIGYVAAAASGNAELAAKFISFVQKQDRCPMPGG
ncbi:hypothetical protein BGX30_013517 [Mortierella sp. GBA39]|nr:hypothetical protein BGX30_013517 [Mortierella sp. GBA39]